MTKNRKLIERAKKECVWHLWFAWYPVVIVDNNGFRTKAWLERVGRKRMIIDRSGEMYSRYPAIVNHLCCPYEDLLANKLKDDNIINKSDYLEID